MLDVFGSAFGDHPHHVAAIEDEIQVRWEPARMSLKFHLTPRWREMDSKYQFRSAPQAPAGALNTGWSMGLGSFAISTSRVSENSDPQQRRPRRPSRTRLSRVVATTRFTRGAHMRDLVLTGGRIIDPGTGRDETAEIAFGDGKVAEIGRDLPTGDAGIVDVCGLLVVPGLIDLCIEDKGHIPHR
jgi:hypothetical protein